MGLPSPTQTLAILRQTRAILALLTVLVLALPWALMPRGPARSALAGWGWRILLGGFGVVVRCHGPRPTADSLIVANHVSWIDIAALAGRLDCGFVAKSEVGQWPVIGALARRQGCLFIARDRRRAVQPMLADMAQYGSARPLVLFPEGTTGLGETVLPFRSSLFAVASERWASIQPVTLTYRHRSGRPLSAAERRQVAWIEDDALLPHALALAAAGGVRLDLWFEPPMPPGDRKANAAACHARIAARLAADDGQAAALKRAA